MLTRSPAHYGLEVGTRRLVHVSSILKAELTAVNFVLFLKFPVCILFMAAQSPGRCYLKEFRLQLLSL